MATPVLCFPNSVRNRKYISFVTIDKPSMSEQTHSPDVSTNQQQPHSTSEIWYIWYIIQHFICIFSTQKWHFRHFIQVTSVSVNMAPLLQKSYIIPDKVNSLWSLFSCPSLIHRITKSLNRATVHCQKKKKN